MIVYRRPFVAAVLVFVLLASVVLFRPAAVQACPVPMPQTLLSLYLNSDLIVVAEIVSEKDGTVTDDQEGYYFVEVARTLKISSTIKGKAPKEMTFTKSEYRDKSPEPEKTTDLDEITDFAYGYRGNAELKAGERYLLFFTKDEESGDYELTDDVSAVKGLSDRDLNVHKKRLKELQSILSLKKDRQLDAFTDWLVRLADEPSTRWDGVSDLESSFEALERADEEDLAKPFTLDEDYDSDSPAVARNLTDAQKEQLSSALFTELQQRGFEAGGYGSLSWLVRRWDKARLAAYAFGVLQGLDASETAKIKAAIDFLSEIVEDEQLSEIAQNYPLEETEDAGRAGAADGAEPETKTVETAAPETKTSETTAPTIETTAAPNPEVKLEDKTEAAPPTEQPEEKKPTVVERRAELLRQFSERYQYLVAVNFTAPEAEPVAEK